MINCYIGIGSNLHNPQQQVEQAILALLDLPKANLIRRSSWYRSRPVGPVKQDDFINGVALIQTKLTPLELLDALQAIESRQGRIRQQHWGPRTLDLDLLLYGDQTIEHPRLVVPHIQLKKRRFVLEPLHEISPELKLPCQKKISHLLELNKEKITPII